MGSLSEMKDVFPSEWPCWRSYSTYDNSEYVLLSTSLNTEFMLEEYIHNIISPEDGVP